MKEREVFLDKMRVAATCAVLLLHTVTGVMDTTDMSLYPSENKVFLVALDLICWCVPVFLMISGYLFLNPARKIGMGQMLTKYCRRIVLALFLFGVPYACLEQIAVEEELRWDMLGEAFRMVLRGESWSHLWYLYLILLLYFLTPFLKWALARIPRQAVYGLLGILFLGSSATPYLHRLLGREHIGGLPDAGIYFFYYICGYLFATRTTGKEDREEREVGTEGRRVSGSCLPMAAALVAAAMVCSRLPGTYTVQMAYNYPFTVLLSLLLFGWGVTAVPKADEGTVLEAHGLWEKGAALSFTVYLVHPVFLNIAYKFLYVTPLSFPIGISLPLFFAGTLLLSSAAAWILRKIPPLRKYVL